MVSSKINYLDFEIIKEDWAVYILSNDVKIKVKQSVVELTTEDPIESDKKKIKLGLGQLITSIMDSNKGTPGKEDHPKIEPKNIIETLNVKPLKIPVNVYEVPKHNKILLARLQLNSIHKTNLFNTKGYRIYDVQTVNDIGVFDAPAILKHEEKKQI